MGLTKHLIMNKNIELKAYCSDPDQIRDICVSQGAKIIRSHEQKDTYFAVSNGRLKLRESNVYGNCLIYYLRSDSPTVRESLFEIVPLNTHHDDIVRLLSKALGVRTMIHKQRDSYEWDSSLINIDTVKNLGHFIEIEVDVIRSGNYEKALALAERLRSIFNIKQIDIIPWSYAELKVMYDTACEWRQKLKSKINNRVGTLFLLDGASCSGKTTLAYHLIQEAELNLKFVPRYCTRKPRQNETLESEYIFVSSNEFTNLATSGAFIEYRDFKFGMSYGLPWKQVADTLLSGIDGLGIMDLGNVRHIKETFPEAIIILVYAPVETIRRRLIARGVHTHEQIEERLENARNVDLYKSVYDYIINNDDGLLEQAQATIKDIIISHHSKA